MSAVNVQINADVHRSWECMLQPVSMHEYSKYRSTEVYLTDQQLVRVHEYTREVEVYAVIHDRQFVRVHEHNKYRSTEV